jgi:hypothetical protein
VLENLLDLSHEKPNYRLDIKPLNPVREAEANTEFDKLKRCLITLKMSISIISFGPPLSLQVVELLFLCWKFLSICASYFIFPQKIKVLSLWAVKPK